MHTDSVLFESAEASGKISFILDPLKSSAKDLPALILFEKWC